MVQVMAVVILVIFAVMLINQVVAVDLNHVMTVVALTTVVHVLKAVAILALALAVTALTAVVIAVATAIQHRANQMATQLVMLAVLKDRLVTVHVVLVTVMPVVIAQIATAAVAIVQAVIV